jgi:DNA-directed RNA polymerase subunit alpha
MSSFQFECSELNLQRKTDYYGRFLFPSLATGQGITIGNVLRRVLLYSLTGIAITEVRISDINHEFATIPGIREDVLELVLNLKEVILTQTGVESRLLGPPIGRLKVQGPAIVTASSFVLPPDMKIVNPGQYIGTISDDSVLEIDIMLEFGQGYTLADNKPLHPNLGAKSLDRIDVDAVFMPVKRVAFDIETTFSAQEGAHERLTLEIWTNGSITPSDALNLAKKTIIDWFHQMEPLYRPEAAQNISSEEKSLPSEGIENNNLDISTLQLSSRVYKSLTHANIHNIGELKKYPLRDLKKIKNLGPKGIQELTEALKQRYGILLSS